MEKRIKILYIITIIAIIAFLGMQMYWLYIRYELTLTEKERVIVERIISCVDDYNKIRETSSDQRTDYLKNSNGLNAFSIPSFSLQQEYGDTVKTKRTSKIYTYLFSAHELLGLEPGTELTEEQKLKAAELAQQQTVAPADSVVFDTSGAKDENEAWIATKNVQIERRCPFSVEGIDSILNKSKIRAKISLVNEDSMVWVNTVSYHSSVFDPSLTITIPYSQIEGKTVRIVSMIDPSEVIPGMGQTLIITLLVSCLLILCLIFQFSTVLKLSRIDKMRNSFITTMIHELKRPISTLKMCVSGLDNKRMVDNQDIRKELLTETRTALDNLSAYFSKLRDITFNNVEQIPLNISSVNLHDLFDNVASATALPAGKTVVFNNQIDTSVVVSADRSHLYNIMNNLVENSVKYSGTEVNIKAYTTDNNGVIRLHLSDTGNGISTGDIKHIFNRFYRGKASCGEQPGMGLGLAYVKLLVDAHGGEISVESTEGKGTCFTIKFPQ